MGRPSWKVFIAIALRAAWYTVLFGVTAVVAVWVVAQGPFDSTWNALSRIDVVEPSGTVRWTGTPNSPTASPPETQIVIDGDAATPLVRNDGDLQAWAANGCASVVGPILAVLLAMDLGFATVMILAALGYVGACLIYGTWAEAPAD